MELRLKPDIDIVQKRFDAFWEQEIFDRPMVALPVLCEHATKAQEKQYDSLKDKWTDYKVRVDEDIQNLDNYFYMGDAVPVIWPNLGPEVYSAWWGCDYVFGETTTWSEHVINDWDADYGKIKFNKDHELYRGLETYVKLLLDKCENEYIVGMTDFHAGGDHVAALRNPEYLAMDLIMKPDAVKKALSDSYDDYFKTYDHFYHMVADKGMPATTWTPILSSEKMYIPSNDFSCMISTDMFCEFFIEGIQKECRFFDNSIYHVDGPGALRHLDTLLEIKELDAIQWVPGAGNEEFHKWIDVYKKIQNAGKSIQIMSIKIEELPLLFENLKPEGVFVSKVSDAEDLESASYVLKQFLNWR